MKAQVSHAPIVEDPRYGRATSMRATGALKANATAIRLMYSSS
jgi:hypothetical protein